MVVRDHDTQQDFGDNMSAFGTLGVKGVLYRQGNFAFGPFAEASYYGDRSGMMTSQWDTSFGLSAQYKVRVVTIYGGPFAYFRQADRQAALNPAVAADDVTARHHLGAFLGVRVPVVKEKVFVTAEAQMRDRPGLGGIGQLQVLVARPVVALHGQAAVFKPASFPIALSPVDKWTGLLRMPYPGTPYMVLLHEGVEAGTGEPRYAAGLPDVAARDAHQVFQVLALRLLEGRLPEPLQGGQGGGGVTPPYRGGAPLSSPRRGPGSPLCGWAGAWGRGSAHGGPW